MIRNKKIIYLLIVFIFMIFISSVNPIAFTVAKNDEDLAIREGESYVWTIETLDYEKYKEWSGSYPNMFVGLNTKLSIEYIYRGEDFWYIESECLKYKGFQDIKGYENTSLKIPMVAENYTGSIIGNWFVPKEAQQFFSQWTAPPNYTKIGLTIKHTNAFRGVEKTWEYQTNGIINSYRIKYEGVTIYKWVFASGVISFGYYFVGFTAIAIIGIIFITYKKYRGAYQ